MVKKLETKAVIIDDYSKEKLPENTKSTELSYKGKIYSIDLGPESLAALDAALMPFTESADRTDAPILNPELIRAWALEQGLELSKLGRLPRDVIARYKQANNI